MNKKKILIISAITIAVLLISGLVYYFLNKKKGESPLFSPYQDTLRDKQIREMDELRQKMGLKELSEQEIQQQAQEMDKLRQQAGLKELSEQEIQQQAQEMDKLRQKQLSN